jgi:penicillin-binding protein 1A
MPLGSLFAVCWSRWTVRLALAGLLLISAGGGLVVGTLLALVSEAAPIEELENSSPSQISRVLDRTGHETVAEFYVERRDIVPLHEVPPDLINAFLAIEDERFYQHVGVSPRDVVVSAFTNLRHGRIRRGASTITMQMARKTLRNLTQEQTFERKAREALAALRIEKRYAKDEILAFYLNQIPMGNGLWGVRWRPAPLRIGRTARPTSST